MIGTTISHYKIIEKLGEGGMGVVYKAQDTKLNRTVALKFLPEHIASSEKDSARFLQEAQAAAALNHPNICTIYGIEEADSPSTLREPQGRTEQSRSATQAPEAPSLGARHFIVMEFVDGQTLREKAPVGADQRSALQLKQALDIGIQIAEGLAAAHEKGVVHRDIKPENIMLRKDGRVQIMDFGLAKLRGASRLTKEGSTVGTTGYMSPEQVQGQETDHRSDIFALGVLLYEMIAGRSPFTGAHESAILYEIVNVDVPPLTATKADIDPELDRIVLECLEKEPNERTQSAKQIAIDLVRFKRASNRSRLSGVSVGRSSPRPVSGQVLNAPPTPGPTSLFDRIGNSTMLWPALAILFLTTTITFIAVYLSRDAESPARVIRLTVGPPENITGLANYSDVQGEPVVSPDGRTIAFSADQGGVNLLFVRSLDRFETVSIDGGGRRPFFSPDGKWIAFLRHESIWKVPVDGGEATRVGDLREMTWNIVSQAWHPDGRILVVGAAGLWSLPSSGGETNLFIPADSSKGENFGRLSLSRDGAILLTVYSRTEQGFRIRLPLMSADGKTSKDLPSSVEPPVRIVDDVLIFAQAGQWRAAHFDASTATLLGDPVSITGLPKIISKEEPWEDKSLIYLGRSAAWLNFEGRQVEPVWVSRSGVATPTGLPAGLYRWPRLSPDGLRLAAEMQTDRLSVVDFRTQSRLILGDFFHTEPVWSADGRQIVFSGAGLGSRLQRSGLLRQVSDASLPPDTILAPILSESWPTSWSPDGKYVAFYGSSASDRNDIYFLEVASGKVRQISMTGVQRGARFSPDGRWVAYQSDETGRIEVYVRQWPSMTTKYLVSDKGGEEPAWSPDGRELYYRKEDAIMSVRIAAGPGFVSSPPVELFRGPYPHDKWGDQSYDVGPDGRFLMMRAAEQTPLQVHVVLNWIEEVRQALHRTKK